MLKNLKNRFTNNTLYFCELICGSNIPIFQEIKTTEKAIRIKTKKQLEKKRSISKTKPSKHLTYRLV